jgi:DNA-binding transcriptional MerR regulator
MAVTVTNKPQVDYATPADLAARYHVSRGTIHYWIARGTITPAFRTGNIIRFIAADVDRELKQTEGAGVPAAH